MLDRRPGESVGGDIMEDDDSSKETTTATRTAEDLSQMHAAACGSTATVELECDGVASYASYQNHVPVIRSISIANSGDVDIYEVKINISPSTSFADELAYQFDLLRPGESREITPVSLHLSHRYLAQLTEAEECALRLQVTTGDEVLAVQEAPLTLLAFDQWGGTRSVPELLASFSMPNNPHVDRLMNEAAELLSQYRPGAAMSGYEHKDREAVWLQVSAIYAAITRRSIQYSMPPAGFATDGQKIRPPDRILAGGVATCLDAAMLLVSCLEQARLNPVILLKENHAWVGVWLVDTTFATSTIDDVQSVRKRIDTGELMAIEATGLTAQSRMSLRQAQEKGRAQLFDDEDSFAYAVDVRRARLESIVPLTTRDAAPLDELNNRVSPAAVEAPPILPPLVGETVLLEVETSLETPADRVARWQSKLLDLTMRNRLLNFKATKVMIPLRVPDLARTEDALADGCEWKLRATPAIMEGVDNRSARLAEAAEGEDPLIRLAREAMSKHELLAPLEAKVLDERLYEIFLSVRNGLEETGANTLFLALGFLRWSSDRTDAAARAPIILVPVTLKRESVRSKFSITRHDDDTIVNPTLLTALREQHDIHINGMDSPPTDDHGVDVSAILARFRAAVKDIPKWEVVPDVYLGVFSFHKFVMYSDLRNRQDDLRRSRIVNHLIEKPRESLGDPAISNASDLDDTHAPGELLAPLSADSSQLNALRRAREGYDFVLEGPPGTGKSQTITNLICDALADGKRVLFCSQKMAALSVVERRLKSVGLGPFCLQLHSAKAGKQEVLEQLGETLSIAHTKQPRDWELEVESLTRLRAELNAVVRALHAEHANGLTIRSAIDMMVRHPDWAAATIELTDIDQLDIRALKEMRDLARQLQALAGHLGDLANHPLKVIRHKEWSNAWADQIVNAGDLLGEALDRLRKAAADLATVLGLPLEQPSMKMVDDLDRLCEVLMQAPRVPAGFAGQADSPKVRRQVAELRSHGEARNKAWTSLAATFSPEAARLSAADLEKEWTNASCKWGPLRWVGRRGVASRLKPYTVNKMHLPLEQVPDLIGQLGRLNEEDQALHRADAAAQELLEDSFDSHATDWALIRQFEEWGERLQSALDRFADPENPGLHEGLAVKVRKLAGDGQRMLYKDAAIEKRLAAYRASYTTFKEAYRQTAGLASNDSLAGADDTNTTALDLLRFMVGTWRDQRRWLNSWCKWNELRTQALQFGLSSIVKKIDCGSIDPHNIAEYIDFCYQNWWLRNATDRDEVLRTFNGAVHNQKIADFQEADARLQEMTKDLVVARLCTALPAETARPTGELGILQHQLALQRRHMPIRKLVQSIPTLLPKLKPCLLMSPLSVAQYLNLNHEHFDLVIFDEASQIPVWDAVGVIARGKQIVVVGDPKQLPPTAFFDRGDEEDAFADQENAPPQDMESILDECQACGMAQLSLDWHYRSAHESLIAFSNQRYYRSRLITFPSPVTRDTAVKLIPVNGIYERGGSTTNRAEAEAVVARIVEHFSCEDPSIDIPTVGVVTFNARQMRLIDQLLNAELAKNPDLEERLAKHGDERLFIKNLESVQGDERDVILFSVTYGKDAAGRSTMNFGPINQQGGERRLNVAVTRARRNVEIFASLRPEDIDLAKTRATGVIDLKAYLDYALRGPAALALEAAPTGMDPDSPFEREVMDVLRDAGYQVHPQVGCSGYRIDIGVVDKSAPGRYVIGVECDGASYHSAPVARDRDRLRQIVLEGLGWKLVRVWSTDWWNNRSTAKAELLSAVNAAQETADELRSEEGIEASSTTPDEPDSVNEV